MRSTAKPMHLMNSHAASVFIALLVLLGLTVVMAQINLGFWNFPVSAGIATAKGALIMLYFMQVRYSKPLCGLFAVGSFFWLAILFSLTFTDYLTR